MRFLFALAGLAMCVVQPTFASEKAPSGEEPAVDALTAAMSRVTTGRAPEDLASAITSNPALAARLQNALQHYNMVNAGPVSKESIEGMFGDQIIASANQVPPPPAHGDDDEEEALAAALSLTSTSASAEKESGAAKESGEPEVVAFAKNYANDGNTYATSFVGSCPLPRRVKLTEVPGSNPDFFASFALHAKLKGMAPCQKCEVPETHHAEIRIPLPSSGKKIQVSAEEGAAPEAMEISAELQEGEAVLFFDYNRVSGPGMENFKFTVYVEPVANKQDVYDVRVYEIQTDFSAKRQWCGLAYSGLVSFE